MRQISVLLLAAVMAGCLGLRFPARRPEYPKQFSSLTLVGQYSIAPLSRIPPQMGLLFGGISGITMRPGSNTMLGITDANDGGRIYTLDIEGLNGSFKITPTDFIALGMVPGAFQQGPDQESMAVLPDGDFLVSTEGSDEPPRVPPAVLEYGPQGQFVRALPLADRFVPEPTGTVTKGARGSAGFEGLALTPDSRRLFVGTETALVQDGEMASFDAGSPSRILEYVAKGDSFEPRREFVYPIDQLEKPPFKPGFFINGLVDLIALDGSTLLALERGHVEDAAKANHNVNRIRIYKVSLAAATDVSRIDSLKGRTDIVPAAKTLVLDLSTVKGLSPDLLATDLDNFEGMTFGPRLPDGRASLIMVSDDNFNPVQRTWFLLFAIE